MDKLQPIIKNRFWILGALTLPLAIYGFFSANSALKAETEQREANLSGLKIPAGTNDPNEDYKTKLSEINQQYEKNVEHSIVDIWNHQKQRMTWPKVVADSVPEKFLEDEFDLDVTDTYRRHYKDLMLNLQERLDPVKPLPSAAPTGGVLGLPGLAKIKQPQVPDGKVIVAAKLPVSQFDRLAVTSEQVWNAQIDIWLLELLFDAINKMNEDKESVTEAVLRRVDVLRFFGGTGTPSPTGAAVATAAVSGYGGYGADSGYGETYAEEDYGDSGYGQAGLGASMSVDIKFDPAQEFGSSADTTSTATATPSAYGSSYGSGYDSGGGSYGASSGKQLRYIADSEEKKVLERGFYMSVIIMQNKIPDFIVELANSDWPIRVTRFHVGKNPYFKETRPTSGMGGPLAMSGGYGAGYGSGGYGDSSYGGSSYGGGGGSYGGGGDYGGSAYGAAGASIPGFGSLTTNLPKYATDAMNHPDLVQLDLCGVITMYKQPQEVIDRINSGTALDDAGFESPASSAPVEPEIDLLSDPEPIDETEATSPSDLESESEEVAEPVSPETQLSPETPPQETLPQDEEGQTNDPVGSSP